MFSCVTGSGLSIIAKTSSPEYMPWMTFVSMGSAFHTNSQTFGASSSSSSATTDSPLLTNVRRIWRRGFFMPLMLYGRPAAVHREHRSCYVRGFVRSQKQGGIGDLARFADAAQERLADLALMQFS